MMQNSRKILIFSFLLSGKCAESRVCFLCTNEASNLPGTVKNVYLQQFINETKTFAFLNVESYIAFLTWACSIFFSINLKN
jgi:hypothetical protein